MQLLRHLVSCSLSVVFFDFAKRSYLRDPGLTLLSYQHITLDASPKSASKTYNIQRFIDAPAHSEPHLAGRCHRQHDKNLIIVLDDALAVLQGISVPKNKSATSSES
jgi:hypothetical protein